MKKIMIVFMLVVMSAIQAFACAATTKKGTLCKRAPVPGSQYCWQHGGRSAVKSTPTPSAATTSVVTPTTVDENRCKGKTKAGAQCKRSARKGSKYCWQHEGQDSAQVDSTNSTTTTATKTVPSAKDKTVSPAKGETGKLSTGSVQCTAMTKSGKRCTRKAQPNSDKCWQHQ